jgi:hypothetical protein
VQVATLLPSCVVAVMVAVPALTGVTIPLEAIVALPTVRDNVLD